MPGAPLSLPEREEIFLALTVDREVFWASIARRVDRHPTTIAREVERRGGREKYRPVSADRAAEKARRRRRDRLLAVPVGLRERMTAELREGWSPEAIWADLRAESAPVVPCVETIYQAVYCGLLGVKPTECLRSRRPRRRSRQARHPKRRGAGLPNFSARPAEVNDRAAVGHWEIDQIIGARNQSSLITFAESVSRYTFAITMPDGYDADATLAGLGEGLDRIPANMLRSVTFDQGSEWAEWETLTGVDLTAALEVHICPQTPRNPAQIAP